MEKSKKKVLITNVTKKVLAENDFSGLDVNKVSIPIYKFRYSVIVLLDLHFIRLSRRC